MSYPQVSNKDNTKYYSVKRLSVYVDHFRGVLEFELELRTRVRSHPFPACGPHLTRSRKSLNFPI